MERISNAGKSNQQITVTPEEENKANGIKSSEINTRLARDFDGFTIFQGGKTWPRIIRTKTQSDEVTGLRGAENEISISIWLKHDSLLFLVHS